MFNRAIKHFGLFRLFVGLFFSLLSIHVVLIVNNIILPIPLAYGPLLYFIFKSSNNERVDLGTVLMHLTPMISFLILFVLNPISWYVDVNIPYMICSFCLLAGYPIYVLYHSSKLKSTTAEVNRILFVENLALLGVAVAFFFGLLLLHEIIPFDVDVNPLFVVIALMIITMGLIIWYGYTSRVDRKTEIKLLTEELTQLNLSTETIEFYKAKLHTVMESEQLFLDANLNLERLSTYVNIPKQHISYIINTTLSSNFYEWLAKYRIAYATQILSNGSDNLKLEFLANLCGFNSRTSFTRYFKQINGLSPSEYRSKLLQNI
ncbi:helix-turn-helix domain-containing protein [Sphingobacterium sp. DK4209]|uniref:Helix-turn-helix domain-containing protein n=1 Tax=Sphingobacterium zhuxiongii TaxID=2662364 RepID=A0A5Q0Q9P3_9SPHI|nr:MULTISPECIES: AraC family transcriptional regulator [unclassified Sphingobacterium]MVZ67044.1 helix-turn-helix domain-containing protein [Sphingobacterium sp. DK4209]QGA26665.1 helix-turn-helix domain-containing protein [Sphingobacterium sp. dk4302]